MRERSAIAIYMVLPIVTIAFFSITAEKSVQPEELPPDNSGPSIMLNGRAFDPSFVDQGEAGRMVIVVDQEDLYIGENTVEIHWGMKPPATMKAELPAEF